MDAKRIHNLFEMRKDYNPDPLDKAHLEREPFAQFSKWFGEAVEKEIHEANAMALSTVNGKGKPSSRIVLLKSFSEDGFLFFTNYSSRKGADISENKNVALLFFWPQMMRQVRVEGVASKCDPVLSDQYFYSRPLENRVASALSKQSEPLEDKSSFEAEVSRFLIGEGELKRPENWGGYIVKPSYFEFWQGGSGRSHDRFTYDFVKNSYWNIKRLYP